MSVLRTYRDWLINVNPDAPASMFWQAVHKDYDASYEGPEDGWVASHPVLSAKTEKDLMIEIDYWYMDEEDEMNKIEPTQADCDAAEPFMGRMDGWYLGKDRYEDLLIEAFARHRIASTEPLMEQMAEALAKGGTLSTEPAPLKNFPRARKLVIGFANPDDCDDAMVAVSAALAAYRASKGEA